MTKPRETDVDDFPIADIDVDTTIQPRVDGLNQEIVERYAELYSIGMPMPRIVVFRSNDDGIYRLACGFHRLEAQIKNGAETVDISLREGGIRDAIVYACMSNNHGYPLTQRDRQKAIKMLIDDGRFTADDIGKKVGVSLATVYRYMKPTPSKAVVTEETPDGGISDDTSDFSNENFSNENDDEEAEFVDEISDFSNENDDDVETEGPAEESEVDDDDYDNEASEDVEESRPTWERLAKEHAKLCRDYIKTIEQVVSQTPDTPFFHDAAKNAISQQLRMVLKQVKSYAPKQPYAKCAMCSGAGCAFCNLSGYKHGGAD